MPPVLTRWWLRIPIGLLIGFLILETIPRWWSGRDGYKWFDGDPDLVTSTARSIADTVRDGVSAKNFTNDSSTFKGEWWFGTYQMSALSLMQVSLEHPELRDELMPAAELAIDRMLSPEVRAFDTAIWQGEDAIDSLDGPNAHCAYLGYMNVALGVHRRLVPDSRFAEINDRISNALARRLSVSRGDMLETYPYETYPVDNTAVISSLILHQKNSGTDHSALIARTMKHLREDWRDPDTGLLHQSVDVQSGQMSPGRASGTALSALLLSYSERDLSRELYEAVRQHCGDSLIGFDYIDEYPDGQTGPPDVDSGPLIFGISPSGCAFTLAAARMFQNREHFVRLYRTANLMGTPVTRGGQRTYVTGGPLGNALLFAMLTARPELP